MTPEERVETLHQEHTQLRERHRRRARRDRWIMWGVLVLAAGLFAVLVMAGLQQVQKTRAQEAAQAEWQREQRATMQALIEEVRRVREIVEERR
jgi:hypothetical protein